MIYDNETFRIINSLGDVSIDEFDDRLRLQKLGYLAQEMGASGGFMFWWYIRGPYSPSLTRLLYDANDIGKLGNQYELTPNEHMIIKKMERLLGRDNLANPRLLELYASAWYLLPSKEMTEKDVSRVVAVLREKKPDFDESKVRSCISAIKEFRQSSRDFILRNPRP